MQIHIYFWIADSRLNPTVNVGFDTELLLDHIEHQFNQSLITYKHKQ